LQEQFSYEGVSQAVELLLNGENNILHEALETEGEKTLLQHLNCDINMNTFTATLRKWSEGTSTSPSGRHLGHYKCPLVDDKPLNKYTTVNPDPKDKIMEVYYKLATTALWIRASLQRWQQSITTMIEKVPGNPKINKLRVIHH
jgi:hypothetical protein